MKIYILTILFFTLLSCNTKSEKVKKELVSKKLFKPEIQDTLSNPFGKVTVNLPYGSKIISEYKFPKEWKYISIFSDNYNPNKINSNSKKINYIDSVFNSKHSLNKSWKLNYKIDTTNYNTDIKTVYKNSISSNFRFIEVLPNIQNVTVILRSYRDEKKGIHLIDLFTINQLGKVIDNINLYYSLPGDLHTSYKFFHIDKLYKVTIKKFEVYEDQTNLIGNERYTILKTGKIQQVDKS